MQDVMFFISETKLMYLHVVFVGDYYKGWPLRLYLTMLPSPLVQAWMYMFFKIELLYSGDELHNVHGKLVVWACGVFQMLVSRHLN